MVLPSEKREGSQEGLLGVGANILVPGKTSETLVSILVQLGLQLLCLHTGTTGISPNTLLHHCCLWYGVRQISTEVDPAYASLALSTSRSMIQTDSMYPSPWNPGVVPLPEHSTPPLMPNSLA